MKVSGAVCRFRTGGAKTLGYSNGTCSREQKASQFTSLAAIKVMDTGSTNSCKYDDITHPLRFSNDHLTFALDAHQVGTGFWGLAQGNFFNKGTQIGEF